MQQIEKRIEDLKQRASSRETMRIDHQVRISHVESIPPLIVSSQTDQNG